MPFPVDIKWVRETESRLGVTFPQGFVASMVAMNGGTVTTSNDQFLLFPFLDASDKKRLSRTCGSIDRETIANREAQYGFPEGAIAIGDNGGGDLLILLPSPNEPHRLQDAVFWWDHECDECHCVADDFGEFEQKP